MAHRHVANRTGAGRLRPGGARIVVRQTDDPSRPPFDTADDPEPVRIDR
jgi:hypothetical protein